MQGRVNVDSPAGVQVNRDRKARRNYVGLGLLLIATTIMAAGCAGGNNLRGPKMQVAVDVAQKANGDSPIAVDLVFVRGDKVESLVDGASASEWFSGTKDKVESKFQEGRDYMVHEWEWVPSQEIDVLVVNRLRRTTMVAVFADYRFAGPNVKISERAVRSLRIRLDERGMDVTFSRKRKAPAPEVQSSR